MKTKCMSCGGTTKKMQKGGSKDTSITGKIQRGLDWMLGSDNLRKIGRETNAKLQPAAQKGRDYLNKTLKPLKPKSTVAKIEKKQHGGFPITAKAAARKVAKGKGMMTYNYGTKDVPGSDGNKGAYVKFAKNQEPNPYGGKTLQGRSRRVMQKGGVKK